MHELMHELMTLVDALTDGEPRINERRLIQRCFYFNATLNI